MLARTQELVGPAMADGTHQSGVEFQVSPRTFSSLTLEARCGLRCSMRMKDNRRIPVSLARHLIIGRSPDSQSLMPLLRQSLGASRTGRAL